MVAKGMVARVRRAHGKMSAGSDRCCEDLPCAKPRCRCALRAKPGLTCSEG